MFPYEDSKTVSVCPYPEKRNQPGFVNISPTLVIGTSMENSLRVLQRGNPFFFSKNFKLNFISTLSVHSPRKENTPGFVNITHTLVIDPLMERFS